MVSGVLLKPLELVIHPFLIDAILLGTKVACMIQGDYKLGQRIVLQFHPEAGNNKTINLATGRIVAGIGLKLIPSTESIFNWTGFQWKPCGKEKVKQIIKNEGINNTDDFWKVIKGDEFETNQIYFDITEKLI